MNNKEFSREFDILYNNIMSNSAPGLNEYEKSVFLTQFQEQLIIDIYSGKTPSGNSFESNEEIRRYLDTLIQPFFTSDKVNISNTISKKSQCFKKDDKIWFIIYESAIYKDDKAGCKDGEHIRILPITHDEYLTIKDNPFRGDNINRVLKIDSENNISELISNFNIESYYIRYIEKPSPIILEDLSIYDNDEDKVTIDGMQEITDCKLHSALHRVILNGAVYLAIQAYKGS